MCPLQADYEVVNESGHLCTGTCRLCLTAAILFLWGPRQTESDTGRKRSVSSGTRIALHTGRTLFAGFNGRGARHAGTDETILHQ
jgi:hypothetical protein